MKIKSNDIIMQNKVFIWIALATAVILLIPLITMQFTDEVAWTLLDFSAIGALLFGASLMFVLAARKTRSNSNRVIIGSALAAALLYLWAELAVGIFTTWGS